MRELRKHISFFVPASLHRLLTDLALIRGKFVSDVVRERLDPDELQKELLQRRETREREELDGRPLRSGGWDA